VIHVYIFSKNEYTTISFRSGLRIKELKNMQLFKYEGYIEEKFSTNGRHRWFTSAHLNPFYNKFYGIRYCPQCLKEHLYFRDIWRLMFVNICTKHKCYLLNSCPKCNSTIFYTSTSDHRMYECIYCNSDIRDAKTKSIRLSFKETKVQKQLQNIAHEGYYIFDDRWHYSIGLFNILKILIRNVMKVEKNQELKVKYIEYLSPHELSLYIKASMDLLEGYPAKLKEFRKNNKLTREASFFEKHEIKNPSTPNWFFKLYSNKDVSYVK